MQVFVESKAIEVIYVDNVHKISSLRELESYFAAINSMCILVVSEIESNLSISEMKDVLIELLEVRSCLTDEHKHAARVAIECGHSIHLPDFQIKGVDDENYTFRLQDSRQELLQGGSIFCAVKRQQNSHRGEVGNLVS